MQQRRFGNTDLVVSEIGFGCARIGGFFEGNTKSDLLDTLRAAYEAGITFFDTADMYTQGESEKLLGAAFRQDRHKIVIASKAGYCLPAQKKTFARIKPLVRPLVRRVGLKRENIPSSLKGTITQDFSPAHLTASVEGSLRRLKTDYLDLFQLHSPPTSVLEHGEFLAPLEKLKAEGKIRYYGVSCETTNDALVCLSYPEISSLQIRMSLLEQTALPQALPRASERGIAIIAREVYAGGMLAKPGPISQAQPVTATNAGHPVLMDYRQEAQRLGLPLSQLALKFALATEPVTVALVGIRTRAHLDDTLRYYSGSQLTAHTVQRLRARTMAAG